MRIRHLLITAPACALMVALPAGAYGDEARADRRCGNVTAGEFKVKVTIDRGRVTCRTARKTVRRFYNGDRTKHGGPSNAETWWEVGRWRCGLGAGGMACNRHGTDWDDARDRLFGEVIGSS
jgi:hypothetical protein